MPKRWLLFLVLIPLLAAQSPRLEEMRGKTVLLFTPHPDDDAFCCAGTLSILVKNQNRVIIAIYTNDDKGSADLEMTSERLARIRKGEQEQAARILGIPKENLIWMGHHDGMLEYVPAKELTEQATLLIRKHRPDVVMLPDPGGEYVRWHKTDHRMAANNTADAIRAAEWHLYFPNHRTHLGLEPWRVPMMYFYYTGKDANYWVNIDAEIDRKLEAITAHVSQFEPAIQKYRPEWNPADLEKTKAGMKARALKKDGRFVEAYRAAGEFNPM